MALEDILNKAGAFAQSDLGKSLLAAGLSRRASKRGAEAGQELLQEEGRKQQESGQKLYETMLKELRECKYDVAQGQRDTAEDAKIAAEEFVEATRRRGQESRGDLVSAIQSGDPRMSALVPRQAQALAQNLQQAELLGLDKKVAADAAISDLEQKYQDANLDRKTRLDEMELGRGAQGAESGRQMELNAMLRQMQAGPNALRDGLNTGLATYASLQDPEVGEDKSTKQNTSISDLLEFFNNMKTQEASGEGEPEYEQDEEGRDLNPNATFYGEDGGAINFEDGGGMTNGEFSHENNPKAIIDEETGMKEGEVTGGELVFNNKQSSTIEELVNSGKGGKLVKFMKNLLSKKQFQE